MSLRTLHYSRFSICSLDVDNTKQPGYITIPPPDYVGQNIISARCSWLLKYRVQVSIFISSAVLEARGESNRKQSSVETVHTVYSFNNVDAGFALFTKLSSKFLNQLNILLLEQ